MLVEEISNSAYQIQKCDRVKTHGVFRAADCKWADRLIDHWVTICHDTTICTTRPLKTQSIKALDCTIKYGDQGESKQI